jgi:hypothetical protein
MLKSVLDALDDLPEAVRAYYKPIAEGDLTGKFLLQIEPNHGVSLENVEGLKNALASTKSDLEQAKSALEGFKGLDAKQVRTDLKELERLRAIDPETEAGKLAEVKFQAQIDGLKTTHAEEISARDARIKGVTTEIERLLITNDAKSAIVAAKGVPELLLAAITSRLKVIEEDGKFDVQVLTETGAQKFAVRDGKPVPARVADLVAEFKANPVYGRAFDGDGRSGGGAHPGNGSGVGSVKNPWAKETFNLTEQMMLLRNDPPLAAAMKSQAGVN